MRVAVTGGTGFIGRSVVRALTGRGDRVVALVRDPSQPGPLDPSSVEILRSDLGDQAELTRQLDGADGVIHLAGSYRVGIPASERPAMYQANVGATERVVDGAVAAGVPRIVVISTVNVFGNTRGRVVDETFRRDTRDAFISYYEETKWLAHQAVDRRIADGAPLVIVQPGTVYGPGDHSSLGAQLQAAYEGTAPFVALGSVGISPCHVDDVAAGIVAALDGGRVGEAYVLAGPNIRLRDGMAIAARVGGHRLPRIVIPNVVLRIGARLAPSQGAMFGLSPNLREILSAADGVTYWASSAKAAAELGYRPRDLESGFADAFGAART